MPQARRLFVRLLLVLAVTASNAAATPADVPLRDYNHTTWTHHDGVPLGHIASILQTSDGYLWIFTSDGLLRFDGMRFVSVSTPCTAPPRSNVAAADGGFWAVCGQTLIRRTPEGRFVALSQVVPPVENHTLLADRQGRLWMFGSTIRSVKIDGTGARELETPRSAGFTAAQDSSGTIWVTDGSRIFHLSDDRAELVQTLEPARCFTPARAGGVLVTSRSRIWHLRKDAPPALVVDSPQLDIVSQVPLNCMREADDGGLWLAAARNVVVVVRGERIETLADTGQFERRVTVVFVDREGAIWAGATSGLHRFRKPTVQFARLPRGQPLLVFADSRRHVWTANTRHAHRLSPDDATQPTLNIPGSYFAIGEDENGTIWLSDESTIGYVADGRFVPVSDVTGKPVVKIDAFARDERGHLWAVADGIGVYRVTPGPPRLVAASPNAAYRFLVSARSGIWLGLRSGGLEQHDDGRTNAFPPPNPGAAHPVVLAMFEDGDAIWTGSFGGLRRLRDGKWTAWTREHGLPHDGSVKAIALDRFGNFWMMTGGGLLRVPRAQLDETPDGSPRPLSFARIGSLDGVVPHGGSLRTSPAVTSDLNGRLYFTTIDAVAVVDPAAVTESSLITPVALESVVVDNAPVDHEATNRFVEPSRLRFEYTSLHLRSPEYARFRYRLDGHDAGWIEAGTQRQITYGTLRPGAYRFRVIGAGSEGVWNEAGAAFDFHIVPVFWRTWWFRLSLVVLGLTVAGGLYRLRIHQLTRQFNVGVEARVGERTRIARELHDTLLQSFQGVLMHFHAATNLLPGRPDEAKHKFERALDLAAKAVTEGRAAVQALRESAVPSEDLPNALGMLAHQLSRDAASADAAEIRVSVEGSSRSLNPIVRDDIYRIAGEGMRNAMRHARARLIHVDIHYDQQNLRLRIRDDGIGIDAAILDGRGVSGHWGLPGMRERAELIGGRLELRSRQGAGTEVELSVPAAKAYAVASRERETTRS